MAVIEGNQTADLYITTTNDTFLLANLENSHAYMVLQPKNIMIYTAHLTILWLWHKTKNIINWPQRKYLSFIDKVGLWKWKFSVLWNKLRFSLSELKKKQSKIFSWLYQIDDYQFHTIRVMIIDHHVIVPTIHSEVYEKHLIPKGHFSGIDRFSSS